MQILKIDVVAFKWPRRPYLSLMYSTHHLKEFLGKPHNNLVSYGLRRISKAAFHMLSRNLAMDLAGSGTNVV